MIAELFGSMVFNDTVMRDRLPKETYRQVQRTIKNGKKLDPAAANIVANAMKDCCRKGCYTFHPLVPANDRHHSRKA